MLKRGNDGRRLTDGRLRTFLKRQLVVDCFGFLWKTLRLTGASLFFCPQFRFSKTQNRLSTGVFQWLWISIIYLLRRWKFSKEVFHKLLKTHVDLWGDPVFSVFFPLFFSDFCRNALSSVSFLRKFRTKF